MKISRRDQAFLAAIGDLTFANPFLPLRLDAEARALGRSVRRGRAVWSSDPQDDQPDPDLAELRVRLSSTLDPMRDAIADGELSAAATIQAYEDAVLYLLYDRYRDRLMASAEDSRRAARCWSVFAAEFEHYLRPGGRRLPTDYQPAHVFACFFQIRRAFALIFETILGRSRCIAQLRAACWQSVFTHDLRAYYRGLYAKMEEFTTLIVGPTGTGKELVATAIGRCHYLPFDTQSKRFEANGDSALFALNPSALAPTLIESELFGHTRGAFTGATADHAGYFESCPRRGSVFLDEIGELDTTLQVKLLRVLQSRQFSRLGETRPRRFVGKLIAATHQDLSSLIEVGRFREDFYYRLCSDVVRTPSLAEMIESDPGDLEDLIRHLARRAVGEQGLVEAIHAKVTYVVQRLGPGYDWPGNIRELDQCVRSVLIRGDYEPRGRSVFTADRGEKRWLGFYRDAEAEGDEVMRAYARQVHRRCGSYVAAAAILGLDRRTVKRLVDE